MIEIRMEDIEAYFDQVEALQAENERLREELSEEMLESGQLTIERDAARAELAAARRVVQAVEPLLDLIWRARQEGWYEDDSRWDEVEHLAAVGRAAVGGPGPTPEPPACEHGKTEAHIICIHGGELSHCFRGGSSCPGPTDDERPAIEAQR